MRWHTCLYVCRMNWDSFSSCLLFCTTHTSVPTFIDEIIYAANNFSNIFAIHIHCIFCSMLFQTDGKSDFRNKNKSNQRNVCYFKRITKIVSLLPCSGSSLFLHFLVCAVWIVSVLSFIHDALFYDVCSFKVQRNFLKILLSLMFNQLFE